MLNKISEFLKYREQLQSQGGLWLMNTEEIIEAIASHTPDKLLEVTKILVNLWGQGVFIGSPKRLFESFKFVSNENEKVEIKRQFKEWYNSMKKLNPKLEKVEWE